MELGIELWDACLDALNYHGIPFCKTMLQEDQREGDEYLAQPLGWLETNVVQIMDPKHYWYDEI